VPILVSKAFIFSGSDKWEGKWYSRSKENKGRKETKKILNEENEDDKRLRRKDMRRAQTGKED